MLAGASRSRRELRVRVVRPERRGDELSGACGGEGRREAVSCGKCNRRNSYPMTATGCQLPARSEVEEEKQSLQDRRKAPPPPPPPSLTCLSKSAAASAGESLSLKPAPSSTTILVPTASAELAAPAAAPRRGARPNSRMRICAPPPATAGAVCASACAMSCAQRSMLSGGACVRSCLLCGCGVCVCVYARARVYFCLYERDILRQKVISLSACTHE